MADLAARTWADLETEHITCAGQTGRTSYTARAQRFLESAHLDLGLLYHHPELDTLDQTPVCSTANPYITLAATTYIVVAVVLRDPTTSAILKSLQPSDARFAFSYYDGTAGIPGRYSRFGSRLWFDRLPDKAYKVDLFTYEYPTAPDFTTPTSPVLGRLWHEHILDKSLALAMKRVWRPDLGNVHAELLTDFVARVVQRPLVELPLPELPGTGRLGKAVGGPQG